MSTQLSLAGITFSYPARTVFRDLDFSVRPGERLGIIGENGAGKTTLLRLLAGELPPDSGALVRQAAGGFGYLRQQPHFEQHWSVADFSAQALSGVLELEAAIAARATDLARASEGQLPGLLEDYAALIDTYESREGATAPQRLAAAAHRLGVGELASGRVFATLSGGEQSRFALAATLAANPEVLLLDEPTNNLDSQALHWLEHRVATHRGTVVFCTHDRLFLERVSDAIIEIDAGEIHRHADGYQGYLRTKAVQRRAAVLSRERWEVQLATATELAARSARRVAAIPRKAEKPGFGHGSFRARDRTHGSSATLRRATARKQQLLSHEAAMPSNPLRFTVENFGEELPVQSPAQAPDVGPTVELAGVRVPGRLSIDDLLIPAGDRVLVTGANGAGKSTLFEVIAGRLNPSAGTCNVSGPVGYLAQHPEHWPAQWLAAWGFSHDSRRELEEDLGQLLSMGLFRPAELLQRLGEMSLGQRRRLDVARLFARPARLLLLDEPTNHLSPALADELEQALMESAATVVLISHDRALRTRFVGRRIHLEHGTIVQ